MLQVFGKYMTRKCILTVFKNELLCKIILLTLWIRLVLKKQIHKVKLENKWTKHKATKNSKTRVSIASVSTQHRKISINLVTSL